MEHIYPDHIKKMLADAQESFSNGAFHDAVLHLRNAAYQTEIVADQYKELAEKHGKA